MSPKKLTALAVTPLLALLAACGSTGAIEAKSEPDAKASATSEEEPTPEPEKTEKPEAPAVQELVVVNSAFGQRSYDASVWWYTVILENPNPGHVFSFAEVNTEAYGADGVILDTGTDFLEILPGQIAITGTFFNVGQNLIDHIEVRGPLANAALPAPTEGVGTFSASEVAAVTDSWSTTVGGNLTGTFATEQEFVTVVVVASNPAGTIIGADMAYVDRLPVGGTVRFEVMFADPLPADTIYSVYPRL
ncbi:hypothetical protein [Actinotalea solisilvae]|uniref:hypothetical protein n=1 Tax=Actinotalea solisilvae TaxID=2072922 RepID=UPI0018F24295|nr:hypothetical protein [Actinotalea solisilvae]